MGCWDVFCIICGNPCHSINESLIEDIVDMDDLSLKERYNRSVKPTFIKDLKELNKKTLWMNKCTMLLTNNEIIHDVKEVSCNVSFCNKKMCAEHMGKQIASANCSFTNEIKCGIFIHTDCWKYIKKTLKIELKFGDLPKIENKSYEKIFNINYGDIEKYWEQDFKFEEILAEK
jgi:hypothetical protein